MTITINKSVKKILEVFKKHSISVRIVGGSVRDYLIGKDPVDIDLATKAEPYKVTEIFEEEGYKIIPTGIEFGTVTLYLDGKNFEITTLRKDIKTDGRHAVVEFTDDYKIDAERRDFTINAISYDPFENKLYDYLNGEKDLQKGIVRFIGDPSVRIQEDYLRILRFFRFSSYYSSSLDKDGLKACKIHSKQLTLLSKERIYHELYKILYCPKNISTILNEMEATLVLKYIAEGFDLDITGITNLEERIDLIPNCRDNINLVTLRITILLFILGKNKMQDFMKMVKFPTKQINESKVLYDFINSIIDLENKKDIFFVICKVWYYHFLQINNCLIAAFALDKISIQDLENGLNSMKLEAPKMPIASYEIKSMGYEGLRLGVRKKYLEEQWIKSGFSISQRELLDIK